MAKKGRAKPMYNLNGQVAIITGAASGIGRAIAMRLSLEGAAVVAADLNEKAVGKTDSRRSRVWEGAGWLWSPMFPAKKTLPAMVEEAGGISARSTFW